MTGPERDALRLAIDRRVRLLIADDDTTICPHCLAEFIPARPTQIFCSTTHRRNHNRVQQRNRQRARQREAIAA